MAGKLTNAQITLPAGTTTAGSAPLKLTTQTAGLTSVEQGAMELVGNSLQFTQLLKRRGVMMSQAVLVETFQLVSTTITATGCMQINGHMYIDGVTNPPDAQALVAIDTTTAQNTTITAQFSASSATNNLQIQQGSVVCVEPNK